MSKDAKGWFFFGSAKDDHDQMKVQARVFVNYGYGIFRWEPCQVLGYALKAKQTAASRISGRTPAASRQSGKTTVKKVYIVMRRGQEKHVKEYEL
jgi:hypothetical protein